MEYSDFLERLRNIRQKRNVSQRDLCKAMGKSNAYLSSIETNKMPMRIDDYLRYCELLDVHPASLFDGALPRGEYVLLERKLANLSPRDFNIIKDLATLLEMDPNDL